MDAVAAEFRERIGVIITRFFAQNDRPLPPSDEIAAFAARVYEVIESKGLPPPLAPDDPGTPGGLPDEEIEALTAQIAPVGSDALLADAARQLVKACFYPEFTVCRDSYREKGRDGACRRQELERARRRLSGVHCVDCPYWVALRSPQHEALLAAEWHAGPDVFRAYQAIFLPEDFRALRQWLYRFARASR